MGDRCGDCGQEGWVTCQGCGKRLCRGCVAVIELGRAYCEACTSETGDDS